MKEAMKSPSPSFLNRIKLTLGFSVPINCTQLLSYYHYPVHTYLPHHPPSHLCTTQNSGLLALILAASKIANSFSRLLEFFWATFTKYWWNINSLKTKYQFWNRKYIWTLSAPSLLNQIPLSRRSSSILLTFSPFCIFSTRSRCSSGPLFKSFVMARSLSTRLPRWEVT